MAVYPFKVLLGLRSYSVYDNSSVFYLHRISWSLEEKGLEQECKKYGILKIDNMDSLQALEINDADNLLDQFLECILPYY